MSNIEDALAAASLVVCRAGAATWQSLQFWGSSYSGALSLCSREPPGENALSLKAKGAAQVIIDEFLDGDVLFDRVEKLRNDPSRLRRMAESMQKEGKPEALQEIVDIIMSYLG